MDNTAEECCGNKEECCDEKGTECCDNANPEADSANGEETASPERAGESIETTTQEANVASNVVDLTQLPEEVKKRLASKLQGGTVQQMSQEQQWDMQRGFSFPNVHLKYIETADKELITIGEGQRWKMIDKKNNKTSLVMTWGPNGQAVTVCEGSREFIEMMHSNLKNYLVSPHQRFFVAEDEEVVKARIAEIEKNKETEATAENSGADGTT